MRKSTRAKGPKPGQPGYDESLGGRIRAARTSRKITMRGLAKLVKRTSGSIYMWEVNDTAPPGDILECLQQQFPELKGKNNDAVISVEGLDLGQLSAEKLRLLADIAEQRERINQQFTDQLREVSKQPTTGKSARR